MQKPETKTKGMCIATRCTSVEQFIQMFHRFVDPDSFFVSTLNTRAPGLETSFSVQLQDGTPVLRGMCVVRESWTTPNNPFKTPGVRLGIKRLTANSAAVFEQLLAMRNVNPKLPPIKPPPPRPPQLAVVVAAKKPVVTAPIHRPESRLELKHPARPPTPLPIEDNLSEPTNVMESSRADTAVTNLVPSEPVMTPVPGSVPPNEVKLGATPDLAPPPVDDSRTPGSDLVLPANPLMDLSDAALRGYVECTLYEETGNFFPADDDDIIGVPLGDVIEPPAPVIVPAFEPPRAPPPPARLHDTVSDSAETTPVPVPLGSSSLPPLSIAPADIVREAPPVITARGSLPAVEPMVTEVVRPRRRRSGAWWVLGSLLVLGGAGAGVWFYLQQRGVDEPVAAAAPPSLSAPPPPAVERPKVAEVDTPAKPAVVEPPSEAEKPAPAPGDGPPVVGEGACQLVIASTPAGSMVQLDDKVIAPSPITVATTCAAHKVDISHARYQTLTRNVTLAEGKRQTIDVNLQRPTHAVTVSSNPSGATIFINGHRAGTTPTVINVLGWETVTLEVKKTGFQPVSQRLYSRQVEDKVSVQLVKW